jgi:hypothetical protein
MDTPVHDHRPPENEAVTLDRVQRVAGAAGIAGLLALLAGGVFDQAQFFRSWLLGFLFWWSVAIGCMSILMIQHLTGGWWGLTIRRLLEAGSRTVPALALLFVPVLFGLAKVFLWAQPDVVAHDALLQRKQAYLNPVFFTARAAFYFLTWAALAHFLNKWSLRQDGGYTLADARRLRSLSGPGLVLMGLTITFASVDWAMSLNPHWFSTIYGFMFMVGQALAALTLCVVALGVLRRGETLTAVARPVVVHDLGKLMLAFTMLWAYMHLSQFLIVWSGNLPEEIPWYLTRLNGGWQYLALALVVFHFALPFLLLLSRDLKRNLGALAAVAAFMFVMRLVDLFWIVAPDLAGHHGAEAADSHLTVHLLDVASVIALGGLWLAAFARQLKRRPLLAATDPDLPELLEQPAYGTH